MVSHELRTPLNQIIMPCEMLLEEDLSDDNRDLVQSAHDASIHLFNLVECILEYSDRTVPTQGTKKQIIIAPWCQALLKNHMEEAKIKQLKIHMETTERAPKSIDVYEGRLKQILDQLIRNAVQSSKQGQITLRVDCSEKSLSFAIVDEGPGINADKLKNIFNPFWQIDMSLTREQQGIGMGLAICQKIATQCKWKITVKSIQGKGSTFTLSLPNEIHLNLRDTIKRTAPHKALN